MAAAAVAAARLPPPPIFLLNGQVDMMGKLTDEPGGGGWTKIECASKKAYGCGEHGQEAVEGLKLYVRPGGGHLLTSSLAIRMSDTALRRFDSELELSAPCKVRKDMPLRPVQADGVVQMAEEEDLTVIFLFFSRPFGRNLTYYLVYDRVGASLSMIKYRADLYLPTGTMKPVPKRRGSDFELVLMTSRLHLYPTPPAVLFVCTPEARANPASDDGIGPWQMKTQREEIPGPFDPHVAFCFQGKGFWADLSRGLVHCDLHTTSDAAVDLGFITLPRECLEQMEPEELKLYGTMACVRDSIWLACILNAAECADDLVKIWTLNVPEGKWQKAWWEQVQEVPVSVLWGLDSFKEAGLPQGPFETPILTPDGALCVKLPDFYRCNFMPIVDPVCIFNVCGEIGLLWHGVVHDNCNDAVICPSNFLQMKRGSKRKHGSSETRVDEHHPAAAGLAALAAAESKVVLLPAA